MAASPQHFDYLALGSGEAGKYIAWTLSKAYGKRCAVIERKWIGGSCPNVACLPSKNFLHSAGVAHEIRQASSYGLGNIVQPTVTAKIDMRVVKARKEDMIHGPAGLMDLHLGNFKNNHVEIIEGEGKFVGPKTIEVGGKLFTADNIAICTGSRAIIDDTIPGLAESKPLTHVEALSLDQLPSSLIIIGGGYVGLEFAQAFRRFGSEVTIIDRNSHILKDEDEDVAKALADILSGEGIRFCMSSKITKVAGLSGTSVSVTIQDGQGDPSEIQGSHILVAAGRIPNTAHIGLEEAGFELTERGYVKVNTQLQTTVEGVFAVGDCAGSPHFTHIAFDDFRVVVSAISGSAQPRNTLNRQVPSTLFTSPELAHIGLREHEARSKGIKYRLAEIPMGAFLRTRTIGDTRGFAKALVEADGNKILGFTALGPSAGELLPVVQLVMRLGASYEEISGLIITHPTMAEGLVALFSAVPPPAK